MAIIFVIMLPSIVPSILSLFAGEHLRRVESWSQRRRMGNSSRCRPDQRRHSVSDRETKGPCVHGDRARNRRNFLADAARATGSLVIGGLTSFANRHASARPQELTETGAEARNDRDLYVFFTMDCERVIDRDMSRHGIWGPPDWAFSERSIRRFHAILADEGLTATYFIVPDVAKAHAKLWAELAASGNELGLHLHPQGFGDFRWTRFMPEYSGANQLKLLDEAITVWKDAIGYRPRVFRPGNFSGSPTMFPTLLKAGLIAGSVSLPGRVRKGYFADWAGFSSGAQFLPKDVDRADASSKCRSPPAADTFGKMEIDKNRYTCVSRPAR